MSVIEKSIDVEVPVSTAYDQWTQFEDFPRFMEGVEQVEQLDDRRLRWRAQIAGVSREWEAEIVDQAPDLQITWRSLDGTDHQGTVLFTPSDAGTRVTLRMDFEPDGVVEKAADALRLVDRRVDGDLLRFKEFIEARRTPTGAWRGEIRPSGEIRADDADGDPTG